MPPRMSSLESSTPRFGVSVVFLYGIGVRSGLWNSVDLRDGAAADAREDDHVVFGAQISVAELLIGEVGVGDSVVIECGAHPAFVLRALPGVDVADARNGQRVGLHRGRRGGVGGEAEFLNGGSNLRVLPLRMIKAPARR